MRTKAEALANPLAGDEWWDGIEKRVIVYLGQNPKLKTVLFTDGEHTRRTTVSGFLHWAANAEYLGGAE
jgi:hypothetical protein